MVSGVGDMFSSGNDLNNFMEGSTSSAGEELSMEQRAEQGRVLVIRYRLLSNYPFA